MLKFITDISSTILDFSLTLKFANSLYLSRLCACVLILIQPEKLLEIFFKKCMGIENENYNENRKPAW